ncbi:MAG: S8 family serine peptidase, partial [Acidimicrobiales bacterium]|nr:S8 family serine peptidase [Acidimicrobiales bacterium]
MSGFGNPQSFVARGVLALACLGLAVPAVATPAAAESRRADQWGLDLLAAEFVQSDVDGSGVVVAVLDTDIAAGHADLVGQLVQGYDFVEDRPFDPLAADRQTARVDHATMVAALIVGDADGDGITGVAPGARVMPVRVVPDFEQGTTTALAEGIRWAADNGADVLNISIRTRTDSPRVRQAVEYAVGKGVVVVASGGSDDEGPWYPAALGDVIAVGAVGRNLDLYSGSPRAPYIEVVAPGADVVSASGRDVTGYLNGRGTSFAAPHVAGTVALMRQVAPEASLREIREALRSTARDLGPAGRDDEFGYGLLDLVGSVMWIDRRDPEPPSVSQLDVQGSSLVVGLERGPSFDVLAHEITVDGEVVAVTGAESSTVKIDLGEGSGQRVAVRSRDAAGRTSPSFTVVAAPMAVRAESRPGAVSVTWQSPAQPGVVAFDVAVDGKVVVRVLNGELTDHSTNVSVEPGTAPQISVAAIGPHGIVSSWVEAPRAQALAENTAPSAPGSLSAQAAAASVG